MAEASEAAAWLPAVTAAIAGGFALGGARFGARNDATKWRREKRLEAYTATLSEVDARVLSIGLRIQRVLSGETPGIVEATQLPPRLATTVDVLVLGPDAVARTATRLGTAVAGIETAYLNWARAIAAGAIPSKEHVTFEPINKALDEGDAARVAFVTACRRPLRTYLKR